MKHTFCLVVFAVCLVLENGYGKPMVPRTGQSEAANENFPMLKRVSTLFFNHIYNDYGSIRHGLGTKILKTEAKEKSEKKKNFCPFYWRFAKKYIGKCTTLKYLHIRFTVCYNGRMSKLMCSPPVFALRVVIVSRVKQS